MSDPSQPDSTRTASPFTPTAFYRDPKAALEWLEHAFGFQVAILMTDDEGDIAHAEMSYRGAHIGVAGEWTVGDGDLRVEARSPQSVGGSITQFLWIDLEGDLDAHFMRAKSAGARVVAEPEDQFYGARTYRVLDPEGHVWNFRQQMREVSPEEMERSTGLTYER